MNLQLRTTIDGGDLARLVARAGIPPTMGSPLLELVAKEPGGDLEAITRSDLVAAGWIEPNDGSLTEAGREVLRPLLRPTIVTRTVLGSRREIGTLGLCASDPAGPYVALSRDPGTDAWLVTPGRSFADVSDAVTGQVMLGPMETALDFGVILEPDEFVTLAAILDWRTRTMLQAALDRRPVPEVQFDARELWEMVVEGHLADDPGWAVTLFAHTLPPVDFELSEESVASAVTRLGADDVVVAGDEGRWRCSPALEALADALLPMSSYAAVRLEVWDEDEPLERAHYVFVRGPFALLVVRPLLDDDGRRIVTLDAVGDVELADFLTDLRAGPKPAASSAVEGGSS